jgi:hypothetical protein
MFTPIVACAMTTAITNGCHHRLPVRQSLLPDGAVMN